VKPKLFAIYLFIVLLPLGLLAWLGTELARDEQSRVQVKFRELMANQLAVRKQAIARVIEAGERELVRVTESPGVEAVARAGTAPASKGRVVIDSSTLRLELRSERLARQIFVLRPDGSFIYPLLDGSATDNEKEFFDRTRSVWESGVRFGSADDGQAGLSNQTLSQSGSWNSSQALSYSASSSSQSQPSNLAPRTQGWHSWYWGNGAHLIFWRQLDSGPVVGVEVDRAALLADVVGGLPDTGLDTSKSLSGRISLTDAQNHTIYQWGSFDPDEGAEPDVRMAVDDPLSMWTLNYHAAPDSLATGGAGGAWFNVGTALALGCLVVVGLAVYFFRENTREMREASQRVSFVNQVSHELKTPLTNIRMYAEMMETQLADSEGSARENLDVIVKESQRLSRMIANVLAFAKRQREPLRPSPRDCVPDEAIRAVIEHFRPALSTRGVEIDFEGKASEEVAVDSDFLEQILGNLFGNVEKYAADGREMRVRSEMFGEELTITVSDQGPGIPQSQREEIFQPFKRLSNKLSDGVTGTGIGLSIARELARNHGGELTLEPSDKGATFMLTMATKKTGGQR
jgi:signal transduction histidine kinase